MSDDKKLLDLAILIRKLVRKIKNTSPDSNLADRALDYLKRHGLEGSVLRGHSADGICPAGENPSAAPSDDKAGSATPRTDEEVEIAKRYPATQHGLWISAEFARQLERELAEAKRDADHFYKLSGKYLDQLGETPSAGVERNAVLDEALKRCADYHGDDALLDAPCIFCGYSGQGYWQSGTHNENCRWRNIGGFKERRAALTSVALKNAAPQVSLPARKGRNGECSPDLSSPAAAALDASSASATTLPAMTLIELEHLAEWHDQCSRFAAQTDNFKGERFHEMRGDVLRRVLAARNRPSTPARRDEP